MRPGEPTENFRPATGECLIFAASGERPGSRLQCPRNGRHPPLPLA